MAEVFYFHVQEDRSIKYKLIEPIMQEDKDVATWRFRIPKVLNQIDMSGWSWWFVYVNAKGQEYSELLTLTDDIDEPSSYSTADYDIDYSISKFPGSFSFALEAISTEQGGEISGEWHTRTYSHKVDKTLQGNQAEYAETESDVISALMQEVRNKVNQLVGGATPLPVNLKSQMTDHDKVYLYTGSESGESTGYWYHWNGTDFVPGGQYASGIMIDPTLSQSGQAADAKAVGDNISTVLAQIPIIDSVPTQGSNNAVSSGGVYEALAGITGAELDISSRASFTANKGVRWDDGTLSINETRAYSNYVSVEGFDSIDISMIKAVSSSTYGIAFYSGESVDTYISGVPMNTGAESPTVEVRNIAIPANAKYFRTTWFDTDAEQYGQYTFSCIAKKQGTITEITENIDSIENDMESVKTDVTELLPMKGTVAEPYPNIIDFGQHNLNIDGVSIVIDKDTLTINGATGSSAIRLKLTGEIEWNRSSSNSTAWNSETVDFIEIGKTYNTYAQKISGTVTGSGDVFTFRNGSGTTVLSESKGTVTITDRVAYGMFYLKYSQTFDNAVYKFVLTESTEKIPVEDVDIKVLNPEITVPYADNAVNSAFGLIPKEYSSALYFTETAYAETCEMQGVATDGVYLYYCMHGATDADNSVIGKIDLSTGTLVSEVSNYSYKHANGICYYPAGNELRIAPLANSGIIYQVDTATLEYKGSYDIGAAIGTAWTNLTGEILSVAGIAYDPIRDWFVYLLSKTSGLYHGLAVCTADNQLIKIIKCITDYTALRGGIACDDRYIYVCLGDVNGEWSQALLRMYDYNGNVINDIKVESANIRKNTLEGVSLGIRSFASFANGTIRELTLVKTGIINLLDVLSHFNPN